MSLAFFVPCGPQECEFPDVADAFQRRKDAVVNIDGEATRFENTGSAQYLGVEEEWFLTYLGKEMGKVCQCYVAHISEDEKTVHGIWDI